MLTHWRLCGALKGLTGIGFGQFLDCCDEDRPQDWCFSLDQVLKERTDDLGIPRVLNLPIGHGAGNAALPMGRLARLDGDTGQLSLLA